MRTSCAVLFLTMLFLGFCPRIIADPWDEVGDAKKRLEWWKQIIADRRSLSVCRIFSESGYQRGQLAFRSEVQSCAAYHLKAAGIGFGWKSLKRYQAIDFDLEQSCYRGGWNAGFLTAYDALWSACVEEYDAAVVAGVAKWQERCRSAAVELDRDSMNLGDRFDQEQKSSSLSASSLKRRMISYVWILDHESAWQILLDEAEAAIGSSFPCLANLSIEVGSKAAGVGL